ncbi:hypothetical protein EV294_108153 [Paenibacillus sp. BK033]|nr:hypothetical protein EV294_108153 [Paenibacillus sp. BK033]
MKPEFIGRVVFHKSGMFQFLNKDLIIGKLLLAKQESSRTILIGLFG